MLTHMNLERLKVFYAIYLRRSIVLAAQDLHVTRSAVSQSLKQLESEAGVILFLRDSKKFKPTPEAEELYRTLKPFMEELSATMQGFETGRKMIKGLLKVGAPMDFGSDRLTKLIAQFRRKHPEVTFELTLATPLRQLEMLKKGELDLALIDNGDVHAGAFPVRVQTVFKEDFVLVCSNKNYKDWNLKNASWQDLAQRPFVDYLAHGPVVRMWFKHHFNKSNMDIAVVYSAESVRAVLKAVSLDMGLGVVPQQLLRDEFADLKVITTERKSFINEIVLARLLEKKPSAREQEFVQLLKEKI